MSFSLDGAKTNCRVKWNEETGKHPGQDGNWNGPAGNFSRYDEDPIHTNVLDNGDENPGKFNRSEYEKNLENIKFLYKNNGNTMGAIDEYERTVRALPNDPIKIIDK